MTFPPTGDAEPGGTSQADTVARSASSGVLWMTAQKWLTRVGGLVTIAVLTRLLAPEDFGLVAAATAILPLVYALSDGGFATYIVQAEHIEGRRLSTAFWFSLMIGTGLGGALYLGAPGIAYVLDLPEAVPVLRVLTLSVLIIAIGSVPLAIMRRRMAFRALALMEVSGTALAQVVSLVAAFRGAGAWALVLQFAVSQVVTTGTVWVLVRWHPRFSFSTADFVEMGKFGLKVVANGLVQVGRAWAETGIVITTLGVREMGYLNIAQRLVQTAQDLTAAALLPVSTAAFARLRRGSQRMASAYRRASSITYAAVTPLMVAVAVAAPALVPLLFGTGKERSAEVVPLLVVTAMVSLGFYIDQGLHWGLGHPGRWLAFTTVSYTVAVAVTAIVARYGLVAVIAGWAVTASAEMVARWFVVARLLRMHPTTTASPVLAVLPSAAFATGAGIAAMRLLSDVPRFVTVAITGLVVVIVYLAVARQTIPRTLTATIEMLPRRIAVLLRWLVPRPRTPGRGAATAAPAGDDEADDVDFASMEPVPKVVPQDERSGPPASAGTGRPEVDRS